MSLTVSDFLFALYSKMLKLNCDNMKKIIALITVLALCLAFSSCSKKNVDKPTTDGMSSTAEVTEAQSQT